ncbi:unnamed protein product [Cunninghamella blakesleeana]
MKKALSAQRINNEPVKTSVGTASFYVRSIKLSTKEMMKTIDYYEKYYNDPTLVLNGKLKINIYNIPVLALPKSSPNITHQKLVDARKIWLIHLFGRESILNSQPGGKFIYYLPNKKDMSIISSLKLNLDLDDDEEKRRIKRTKIAYETTATSIDNSVFAMEVIQQSIFFFRYFVSQIILKMT